MNRKQKVISLIGIILIVIMGTIPPWKYIDDGSIGYREIPAGYFLIFSPPEPDQEDYFGVELDMSRLAVQWITLLFVMAAALYLTQDKSKALNSREYEDDDDEDG